MNARYPGKACAFPGNNRITVTLPDIDSRVQNG